MHRLILIRHATAALEGPGIDDFARPLTEHGRIEAVRTGQALAEAGYMPDIALVSAAMRARQTWEAVGPAFGRMIDTRLEPQLYETTPEQIMRAALAQSALTVAVVGHNPTLQQLAVDMLQRDGRNAVLLQTLRRDFPKGRAIVFRFDPGAVHCEGLLP